jgi:hypothetical protein
MMSPHKTPRAKAEAMVESWKACLAMFPQLFAGQPSAQKDMAEVAEEYLGLLSAVGVCVPSIIRCFLKDARERKAEADIEVGEKVLARIEAAVARSEAK